MDRQPARIESHRRAPRIEHALAPRNRVGTRREPIGPRMQERNPEARATLAIAGESGALAQQLLAVMEERMADHPGAGREARP